MSASVCAIETYQRPRSVNRKPRRQGASSVKKNGMFADTRRYVANVQTHMTRFR